MIKSLWETQCRVQQSLSLSLDPLTPNRAYRRSLMHANWMNKQISIVFHGILKRLNDS